MKGLGWAFKLDINHFNSFDHIKKTMLYEWNRGEFH